MDTSLTQSEPGSRPAEIEHARRSRNGKIARLPRLIRNQLNTRIEDAEPGPALLKWLNGLPEVQELLARDFESRPINEQNLSDWRQGGFRDWQRNQEINEQVRQLIDMSDELGDTADSSDIARRLSDVLIARLFAETQQLLETCTDPRERFQYICTALKHVKALRQVDQSAIQAQILQDRWDYECEDRHQEERRRGLDEARRAAEAPLWESVKRPMVVAHFGGGEAGEKAADFLSEIDRKFRASPNHYDFADGPSATSSAPAST